MQLAAFPANSVMWFKINVLINDYDIELVLKATVRYNIWHWMHEAQQN